MFIDTEVKDLLREFDNEPDRLKRIRTKCARYGYLEINLSDYNYLLELNKVMKEYNILCLKKLFHDNNIGYTKLIKEFKIPKATLSKMLNGNRNIKLSTLNKIFINSKNIFNLDIDKTKLKM